MVPSCMDAAVTQDSDLWGSISLSLAKCWQQCHIRVFVDKYVILELPSSIFQLPMYSGLGVHGNGSGLAMLMASLFRTIKQILS